MLFITRWSSLFLIINLIYSWSFLFRLVRSLKIELWLFSNFKAGSVDSFIVLEFYFNLVLACSKGAWAVNILRSLAKYLQINFVLIFPKWTFLKKKTSYAPRCCSLHCCFWPRLHHLATPAMASDYHSSRASSENRTICLKFYDLYLSNEHW